MTTDLKAKARAILELLEQHYPAAHCTLDFANPLELLVATVLSAQCTDERVNKVTPQVFKNTPPLRLCLCPWPNWRGFHSTSFSGRKPKALNRYAELWWTSLMVRFHHRWRAC
jgi:endonuclease-3